MKTFEVVGYKKIEKKGETLYYLSCMSDYTERGSEGLTTYNAFVSFEHLAEHGVPEEHIIGSKVHYYNVKDGDTWKSGITFKNT